ncbi:MAG: ATP-binding protein [Nitrospirales bacterium]
MEPPISEPQSPLKVLLIDNEEDDAILTRAFLQQTLKRPLEFDWVSTFQEGLQRISDNHHDIDLLDYDLGHQTGMDLLHELPAHISHAPIIMLTGHGNESLAVEALHSGAVDYIPKRLLSTEYLQRAIELALNNSRLKAELIHHQHHLEQSNRELTKKNSEIQRFYHVLAHEMKAPLTTALEFVHIMQDGTSGPLNEEQRNDLSIINNCCLQLEYAINDLYDATQIETGKVSIDVKATPFGPLLRQVMTCLASKASSQGVSLQSSLEKNLPNVYMDSYRIYQVLIHLIRHSLKFTSKGGTIRIDVRTNPLNRSQVRIEIQDTGMGIPPDQQEYIFKQADPLDSVGNSEKERQGLDLSICRKLLQLHGTAMTVHSLLGKGSTFSFSLRAVH